MNAVLYTETEIQLLEAPIRLKRMMDDNTRSNIACVLIMLNSGHKVGGDSLPRLEYTFDLQDQEIERGMLTQKLMTLVKNLG